MKILLVEDHALLAEQFVEALGQQRHAVDVAVDGREGWEIIQSGSYDLILLDVMLPKLDGISLCRRLREHGYKVPIILLTARGTSADQVSGLDAGADDYLVKPIRLEELNARIRAVSRRKEVTTLPVLVWGSLQLDPSQCEVTYNGKKLQLTPKEYALIELFLRNNQRVFSRSAIIEQLWSADGDLPGEETVKAHIKGIRQKLKPFGAADLIETVYGLGYRLNLEFAQELPIAAASTRSGGDLPEVTPIQQRSSRSDAMTSPVPDVAKVWQLRRHQLFTQVAEIEAAIAALRQDQFTPSLKERSSQTAHALLGTLATFRVHEGSRLAKQIEALLVAEAATQPDRLTLLTQAIAQLRHTIAHVEPQTLAEHHQAINATFRNNPGQWLRQPLLLIVDDDLEFTSLLQIEAPTWGLQLAIATTAQQAHTLFQKLQPDILLLNLHSSDATHSSDRQPSDTLSLLAQLAQQPSAPPVLVFTDQPHDRLLATHYRAKGVLQKPIPPANVFSAVTQVLHQVAPTPQQRILVIDDQPSTLEQVKSSLELWGLQVTVLQTTHQFWDLLDAIAPDLLILNFDGQSSDQSELCRALRRDARWKWLPILGLSAVANLDHLDALFAVGVDDLVPTPLQERTLLTRVLNRLDRSHTLRAQGSTDLLTGVDTWQQSTQDMGKFLDLAKRTRQPFCLAMLAIDNLQSINQQYGYGVGNQVLRQFCQLLRQQLRREDIIARWGGAEFAVGMYGMPDREGVEWLAEILEVLRVEQFAPIADGTLSVTFSAGLAQYPRDGDTLPALSETATQALHQAKQTGGDRVMSPSQPAHPESPTTVAIVHPDAAFAQEMLRALRTRGYQGQWFAEAQGAIAPLSELVDQGHCPVIFLAEENVPISGQTLLQQLGKRKITQRSRLILLTNSSQAQSIGKLGVFDYVVAPYSVAVLMQRLQQAVSQIEPQSISLGVAEQVASARSARIS